MTETVFHAKGWLGPLLLMLGIAVPLPDFAGGLVLCVGASFVFFLGSPPEEKWSFSVTVAAAVLIGFLVALAHDSFPWFGALASLQLEMLVGGLMSRPLILAAAAFGRGMVGRAGSIPGSIPLPWEKKNGGGQ